MQLIVNDRPHELQGDATLARLLADLGVENGRVAVVVNSKVIARDTFGTTLLAENDRIEVLSFAAGG